MNATQLECFIAVSEHLNFARAAENLHITQPAVTHQINALETELNAKLFNRTTRTVELTPAGWKFIRDAHTILDLMHAAKTRLSDDSGEQYTPFTIGCPSSMEMKLLPQILKILHSTFPSVRPIIKSGPLPALQNHLKESFIDILLSYKEPNPKQRPGTYTELIKAPAACVIHPEHPLALKQNIVPEDLKKGTAILCNPRQIPQAIVNLQQHLVPDRSASELYFCDSIEGALTIIKAGLGYSLLPDIPLMRDPSLRYLPVKGKPHSSFGIYAIDVSHNKIKKKFLEYARKLFLDL